MGYKDKNEVMRFVDIYLNNDFNAKLAMKEVFPYLEDKAIGEKVSRWIHSDDVMRCILDRVDDCNSSPEKLKKYFKKILLVAIDDKHTSVSDRVKAIDMIAKLENMLKEHTQLDIKNITPEDEVSLGKFTDRLLNKYN